MTSCDVKYVNVTRTNNYKRAIYGKSDVKRTKSTLWYRQERNSGKISDIVIAEVVELALR